MKRSLCILLVCLATPFFAQITITSASMPSSGDTIRYSSASPTGIQYAPTGTNYFWDYSNLIALNQGRYDYKAASLTPYSFYFIGFNKYGLKVADSLGAGTFQFTDVYDYFNKTASVYKTEGTGFRYNGIPLAAYFSDDDELYQFPLNYLDRDSSTYAFSVSLGAGISYSKKGYRINEVDGWGSIKTPYDSVACIRLITTQYGIDSINFNGLGFSFPNIQRNYQWLSLTEKTPVLNIGGQYQSATFAANQVRYRDMYRGLPSFGLTESAAKAEMILFPNPSAGEIYFHFNSPEIFNASIVDMLGKEHLAIQELKQGKAYSTAKLTVGIYTVLVTDVGGNIISRQKLVIE
jgi:hypothetical protein